MPRTAHRDDLAGAIRNANAPRICALLLGQGSRPELRRGRGTETELWDFKETFPDDEAGWAKIARHVLAFHNRHGGVLLFGIRDGDFSYTGVKRRLDSKTFNERIRRYLGDLLWVDFHREWIQPDQSYLGLAIIPPRGPLLGYFRGDAPANNGKREFVKGQSAIRRGDSSYVLTPALAQEVQAATASAQIAGRPYAIDVPFFRVLSLETNEFIPRSALGEAVEHALHDQRTSVTSLVGIGGTGKTTLATWAVMRAYDARSFDFIVSVTAKDRELGALGIRRLSAAPTTFEVLLDNILGVLGYGELAAASIDEREREVRSLLLNSNALLYIDNLETVDDARVITFLDDLPIGVRALVTSRRAMVRVAVRPIDVGPFAPPEARALVRSLRSEPGLGYVADLSDSEIDRIADACDRLPLAVRWTLMRAKSAAEAIHRAETLGSSGDRDHSQLLEFVFRRVFSDMTGVERAVILTLSMFSDPTTAEPLIAGTGQTAWEVTDGLEDLARDAIVQRTFDPARNDYVYALAPLTRSFVLAELRRERGTEERIRHRLMGWFEAHDIRNAADREVAREMRQTGGASEHGLLDLAQAAEKRGEYSSAQTLYEQALARSPRSWQAARLLGEFERQRNGNRTRALELYERAGANAPRRGPERALVFREWAMLLRESGRPNAVTDAIEKFEVARLETPNDAILLHALASLYDGRGVYQKVIELLEPLAQHPSPKSRAMFLRLLIRAYDATGAILEAAEARRDLEELAS